MPSCGTRGGDISITGKSTNPTRFQHPVAGTYKKERWEAGKKVLLRGFRRRHGRTCIPTTWPRPRLLRHDRHHGPHASDAQFAGSSSVPAHVEMMGFLGAGNNPMVGMTVAVAVAVQQAMNK